MKHKLATLKNGLALITINLPRLESVATMLAVGGGSRYETKNINGISHFLEHMFFKGSKKYPSAEEISEIIDGIGAVNNAATDKEVTYFWVKSAAKHIELSSDILSSMASESLLKEEEIEREKGVIIEELRMYQDNPSHYVWNLYERLQFGDQPLGWDIGGNEKTVLSLKREDFVNYMNSLYSPKNMALIYAGKIPENIQEVAEKYFEKLPDRSQHGFKPFKKIKQTSPQVNVFYKKTDQVNLVLGVEGYDRYDPKRYVARVLGIILGEGMSSRLFIQVRARRGLAYHVAAFHNPYKDTGFFAIYGGLKLEKIEEALKIIKDELFKIAAEGITAKELQKAQEMESGRMALRTESTNFLAEYFGVRFVLDRKIESLEEYLKAINQVTVEEVQQVASELFQKDRFNLQIIGPLKNPEIFEKILQT